MKGANDAAIPDIKAIGHAEISSAGRFAIVIPVYNHAGGVLSVIERARALALPIWVVDDGSTDGTAASLKRIAGITVLRHEKNLGKGAAILTGFSALRGTADWAVTLDADGQHDPQDVPGLIRAIPRGLRPIIVGRREGMSGADVPWTSRFGRKFSNFWVRAAGGPLLADTQSGMRVYPLPESLQLGVKARRFQFEVEVLVRARWRGIPVIEAPVGVSYTPGRERISHFRPFVDFCRNTGTFSRLIFLRIMKNIAVEDFFYRCLTFLKKRFGTWVFLMIAWHVASGYFLFFPRRVAVSVRFYRRLFPQRGRPYALWCAWQQYHHFVHVFLDRLLLKEGTDIASTYEGWEHIGAAAESGRGGIILMSHVGSWEIAAQLLSRYGRKHHRMRLLLYLGEKHKEQIERRQKKSVEQSGIRVVAVPEDGGSPLDILEGLNFLKEGGLVSLTGDRLWGREQRAVTVRFAGREARIPEMPYLLALLSGAPLLIFFIYRTGRGRYHFQTNPPLYVEAASRPERREAVARAAQAYADLLAETVRVHPYEWYHFEPFLVEHKA